MVLIFTCSVFLSAALLFMVQPMIGRLLLPVLGGSPAVWNTCLVFFQAILLAGYLYAHFSIKWFGHRAQSLVHLLLFAATIGWLIWLGLTNHGSPFALPTDQRVFAASAADPTWPLLVLLVGLVGLPFFVVAASAPLLQSWFSKTDHPNAANPFFLYASSNLGSMLSLAAYPLVMNRYFSLPEQGRLWTWGLVGLLLGFAACAGLMWARYREPAGTQAKVSSAARPTWTDVLGWIALAFVPSSLLTGETTFLATEVLSHPLLWVATLALYLLTFIIVFADRPWISHAQALRWAPLAALLLTIVVAAKSNEPTWMVLSVHLAGFFLLVLVAHGELAQRRPAAEYLTSYYLWMSFGGVLGGAFNSLLSPVIFKHLGLLEYPIGLIAALLILGLAGGSFLKPFNWLYALVVGGIAVALLWFLPREEGVRANLIYGAPAILLLPAIKELPRFALAASALLLVGWFDPGLSGKTLFLERNFYGVLRVTYDPQRDANLIIHGNTLHSLQSRRPEEALLPTAYYYPDGPMSEVFKVAQERGYRQICVAGLGAGGIACYATPGQHWTFYEIDPTMQKVAEDPQYFTFMRDCFPAGGATYQVKLGDARLEMAAEPDGKFDLIVLNAFSSSSPPMHLLTREAAAVYLAKLAPGGMLIYNASNRHLAIEPALAAIAAAEGQQFRNAKDYVKTAEEKRRGKMSCSFVIMAANEEVLAPFGKEQGWSGPPAELPRVWTDQYSDILGSMKW